MFQTGRQHIGWLAGWLSFKAGINFELYFHNKARLEKYNEVSLCRKQGCEYCFIYVLMEQKCYDDNEMKFRKKKKGTHLWKSNLSMLNTCSMFKKILSRKINTKYEHKLLKLL